MFFSQKLQDVAIIKKSC